MGEFRNPSLLEGVTEIYPIDYSPQQDDGDWSYRQMKQKEVDDKTRYIDIELDFTPKLGQRKIIQMAKDPRLKKIVVNIFRQYGKSFVCRYLTLVWMQKPGTTVGYITQTSRLAKDIFKKFLAMYPDELIKSKDGKDFIIELVNGSKLIFFSVEQTHAIRGFTLDYLIWDEVSHCREYTPEGEHLYYNVVAPLLDAKGKKEIFISTPNGKQGFFYELAEKAKSGEKGYAYIMINVFNDETKTDEWIVEKKQGYPLKAWQQEYECQFLEGGVSFFTNFSRRFFENDFDWTGRLYAGIDFSSVGSDDTVLTFENEKGQSIQYIITGELDEKYRQMANRLAQVGKGLELCLMESNSIGEVMGNEVLKMLPSYLKKRVDFIYTSNSSKQDYIEKLALDIEKENVSFMEDNNTLYEQFKTFTYTVSKTGKKIFGALPGAHDDHIISLALANLARTRCHNTKGGGGLVVRT